MSAQRGAEAFWRSDAVTPRSEDVAKFKITLRDALWLLMGCLAMYGAQFAAQYGMRSDIRDLSTQFQSYQQKQQNTDSEFQRQIDEVRREAALNRVRGEDAEKEISEIRGILLGSGIKGVQKP